jgi:hypothetical protein
MGNLPTKSRLWTFILEYYRKNKTTPDISAMLKGLGIQREKFRRAIKRLIAEGYLREDRSGTRKFYVILRMGNYVSRKSRMAKRVDSAEHKLVYIEWEDAFGIPGRWTDIEEVTEKSQRANIIRTVGWIISQNSKRIVLAASLDGFECATDGTIIPKSLIRKRRALTI